MAQDEINIGIAINESFVMPAIVMIESIMCHEHHSIINLRVLCTSLAERSKKRINMLCDKYPQLKISFYGIDTEKLKLLEITRKSLTIETYFRLFFPYTFMDIDKILWLDSDLIVQSSLRLLYNMDIGDSFAAAGQCIIDECGQRAELKKKIALPADTPYFNAGVLLLNLKYWRQNLGRDKLMEIIYEHNVGKNDYDQEVLNVIFAGHILSFDSHVYNVQLHHSYYDTHSDIVENANIVHYTVNKPWSIRYNKKYAMIWWKYAIQAGYKKEFFSWYVRHHLYFLARFCKRIIHKAVPF